MNCTRHETRDWRLAERTCRASIRSRVTCHESRTRYLTLHVILPLMFALVAPLSCVFALDTQRPDVARFIDTMVEKHHFSRNELRSLLRNAESKRAIIEIMQRPPEQVLPWYEYRDRLLTDRRIGKGVNFVRQHTDALLNAEEKIGVNSDAIVGILGVETMFGEITGNYRVLDALATLAFDYPPRAEFFRDELEQFLLLTREEHINARKALGSYAGAIGAPQFMPSNYRRLAMDGDRNGRRDLWNSWPDIIASVGNYLKSSGWRTGDPVTVSATLDSADVPKFDVAKIRLNETVASLRAKGARFETDLPDETP